MLLIFRHMGFHVSVNQWSPASCAVRISGQQCEGKRLYAKQTPYAFAEKCHVIRKTQTACCMRSRAKDAKFNRAERKRPV